MSDQAAGGFEEHRALLFTVAYEMLGSAVDAEDVVQETWLRWDAHLRAPHDEVRDPRAYLVRIVTRQALNRLRTLSRRRETYVGPWLPEPLLTTPDVADDVALADSVSTAMLLVLETLSPLERAVFVLREVFDLPYAEIASAVDRSPEAVRQVAHRARSHVRERQPRQQVTRAEQERVVRCFAEAASTGDLQLLLDVLAPDVVLVTDGGGHKKAALRPILGREKTLRFLAGVSGDAPALGEVALVNGAPALTFHAEGVLDTVITFDLAEGLVVGLYAMRNPDKLGRLGEVTPLAR